METPKTRVELINQVLDNYSILIPGQAPSDSNVAKIDDILDAVLSMLAGLKVVYVSDAGTPTPPSGGAIDPAIFLPLADVVAWRCAGKFNLAGDPALKALDILARADLEEIGSAEPARKALRVDPQLRGSTSRRGGYGSFSRGT